MKRLIVYMAGILLLAGCSTTKHLPEGEILYTGQKKMIVENRSTTPVGETAMEEVEAALATAPNNSLLGKQRVIFPFCFIAGSWRNSGKQLFHCCCIHCFFCNRKFCDFSQQIILNQLEICTVYAAALVYICRQTCCIAGECTGNALPCQCQDYCPHRKYLR